MTRNSAIEERVLRVLYEAPASATECTLELQRYLGEAAGSQIEVERALLELTAVACARPQISTGVVRYALTPAGSERLARLVDDRSERGAAS